MLPSTISRSVPHRPTTAGLISTSPGPGGGDGALLQHDLAGPAHHQRRGASALMTGAGSRGRRPLRLRSFGQAEVDVGAAAQDAGHPSA